MPDTETTTLEAVAMTRAYRYRGSIHVNCHPGLVEADLLPAVRSLAYHLVPGQKLLVATGLEDTVDGRSRDDARSLRRKINNADEWTSTDAIIPEDYFERAFGIEKDDIPTEQAVGIRLALYADDGVLAFRTLSPVKISREVYE